jgi:acyl-CoA reductase-like NAD-dependent aldehyde dehydrogenase
MNDVALLIDGKSAPAQERGSFDRIDPVKGSTATRAAAAKSADVNAAVEAAATAFPEWAAMGPGRRRELLLKSAEMLMAHEKDFTDCMIAETGATGPWAGFNVAFAAGILRESASMTSQITGEVIPSDIPDNLAMAVRQPIGVCAAIAPWNAPVILGVRAIAMPLACGNTVVFKASEACPAVHRLIGTALLEAGVPAGVCNVITNAPEDAAEVVAALIDHAAVRHINFTGSTRVGRIVAERAARHLKPVLLELGGKAPLIVLDDADIDEAVNAAAFGAYMNQGQICMSTERIVVDDRVADEFAKKLSTKAAGLPVRDPSLGPTVLGSMVDAKSARRVAELIHDAVQKGALVTAGGEGHGTLIQATVIDRVTPAMRIYAEESFGPVVTIVRVNGDDEAVRVANDTEYGLSAAVFSRDIARAWHVARRVNSGICHINGPTVHDEPQMPFGGVKASGFGRFGGKAAIEEFTILRWITIQTGKRHYPF